MKKKVCVLVIIVLLVLVFALLLLGKKNTTDMYSYEDDECSISVQVPKEWNCKTVESYAGDENTEGSPDSGIEIYIDGDDSSDIYIFRQVGKIEALTQDVESSSSFENQTGLKGTYYKMKDSERVSDLIVFDNAFYGVSITMDESLYERNEKKIDSLLDSIGIQTK